MFYKYDECGGWIKEFPLITDFENSLNKLIKIILDSNITYHHIYAIPRGGLVIGVWLSHQLNIPMRLSLKSLTYLNGPILIVDDIADTGKTLLEFQDKKFHTATLYYKTRSAVKPTYYAEETKNWIVFPWESWEEKTNRLM